MMDCVLLGFLSIATFILLANNDSQISLSLLLVTLLQHTLSPTLSFFCLVLVGWWVA